MYAESMRPRAVSPRAACLALALAAGCGARSSLEPAHGHVGSAASSGAGAAASDSGASSGAGAAGGGGTAGGAGAGGACDTVDVPTVLAMTAKGPFDVVADGTHAY